MICPMCARFPAADPVDGSDPGASSSGDRAVTSAGINQHRGKLGSAMN